MRSRDSEVARAYLRRITGYEVTEVKSEYKVNEEGELELQKRTESLKHVPGDPRAAEFWLTNRRPQEWRPARLLRGEEPEGEAPGVVELPPVLPEGSLLGEERDG